MAVYSDVDIRNALETGEIVIEPRPENIGPISVDISVDNVKNISQELVRELTQNSFIRGD